MSTTINPYVTLNGTCAEAVAFWAAALKGDAQVMRMGDSPIEVAPEHKDRVMHAAIRAGSLLLMASDSMPQHPVPDGGNVSISLNFTDKDEQTRVWNELSARHGGDAARRSVLGTLRDVHRQVRRPVDAEPRGAALLTGAGGGAGSTATAGTARRRQVQ